MRRFAVLPVVVVVMAVGLTSACGRSGQPPLSAASLADEIVIDKTRHIMTLYSSGRILRRYAVSLGRGGLDPKRREGDNLTPEGRYIIDGRNPNSAFHLSLHISYPDAEDVARAVARGEQPGGEIMIHGQRNGFDLVGALPEVDWTAGCIAVTDGEIEEIWRLVPDGTPVEIRH